MSETIINVENLSKRYRIGAKEQGYKTFREIITEGFTAPIRNLNRLRKLTKFESSETSHSNPSPVSGAGGSAGDDTIWALKDVSLGVEQGEILGIVGRNGAGKSTLLKILSRITEPTAGDVKIYGRISSLLEIGTGFHPELTGRENTFLNGAILGMRKQEIKRKFDEIVAFAEVEKFIDTPVKYYSSGMYMRLAFAVAAHLEPEILLVDEVLAVGDASFQKKCMGKMGEAAQVGRTVLFVSHNMEAIRALCKRAIWLNGGMIQADGEAADVVQAYSNSFSEGIFYFENKNYGLVIQKVVLKNAKGEETLQFRPGEDLVVEIWFNAQRRVEKPYFLLIVQGTNGPCFTANMKLDGHRPEVLDGKGLIRCRFKSVPLLPQNYTIRMAIRAKDGNDPILNYQDVASFSVTGDLAEYGYKGEFQTFASSGTPVVIPYEWVLPDGTTSKVELSYPYDKLSTGDKPIKQIDKGP